VWIPWNWALLIAAGLATVGVLAHRMENRWWVRSGSFARESALVFVLYAVWNFVGRLSVMRVDGALGRAELLWDVEAWLPIPTVVQVQDVVLRFPWLVQASNAYYAIAHVPGMVAVMVWLFWRHREHYAWVRNSLALMTAAGVAVHLIPIAPPRFLPHHGVIDTPLLYGQSVYTTFGSTVAGQLSALPSLHVGWAVLVALATMRATRSPGRWLGPLHAVTTVLVVVATGNHFWLDGLAAILILAFALHVERQVVGPIAAATGARLALGPRARPTDRQPTGADTARQKV